MVKSIGNVLKFRTSCFTSASDFDSEQRKLRLGVEVLVTTPGRLFELLQRKEVSLKSTITMVLDEVDVLFSDPSFPLQFIGEACPETTQFLFTSATLPKEVVSQIRKEFPDTNTLKGPGLHRISPTIEEILIDCSGSKSQRRTASIVFENKRQALIKALDEDTSERTVIFCNSIEQCRKVENLLKREDRQRRFRDIYIYHGAVDCLGREKQLANFCKPLLKRPAILICTDRTSRGLDFRKALVRVIIWLPALNELDSRLTMSFFSTSLSNLANTSEELVALDARVSLRAHRSFTDPIIDC